MIDLEQLIQLCERIAKGHDDKFAYQIEIEPGRHGFLYRFNCYEIADRHSFITGSGASIQAAVKEAIDQAEEFAEEFAKKLQ